MLENKLNFTKKIIESLATPEKGKRKYYYDIKTRGLGISVTDKGTKVFILYRKIDGRPERIKLGNFPDISIENARLLAMENNTQISKGINPNKEKKKNLEISSLGILFEQYLARYAKIHKKSWQGDINLYNYYLKIWENKKISHIKKNDIELLHAHLGDVKGKYAANRTFSLLHTLFNKAIDWGWQGINPCIGIKKFKEKSRDRFLQANEIPKFFDALNNECNEVFRDYFYISLLTGARKSNVISMSWKDINFGTNTWKIKETKNGESQIIHLSNHTLEILQRRLTLSSSNWVFPSPNSRSGHIEEPKKAWKRVLERAGIEDLRIHDLRRTLGSWQAATGANSYIIGKSLGHKTQHATAIYARLNIDPVRESVNKATDAMFATLIKK